MKKILTILGIITLIGTSTTNLVACNTTQYTEKELSDLKEKNKINTNNQEIRNNLEWIAPQEKPFKERDNKWYIVLWRYDKNDDWRIAKFNNSKYDVIDIDKFNRNKLVTDWRYLTRTLCIKWPSVITPEFFWEDDDGTYFKSVYRWNNDDEPNIDVENKYKKLFRL